MAREVEGVKAAERDSPGVIGRVAGGGCYSISQRMSSSSAAGPREITSAADTLSGSGRGRVTSRADID